MTCLQPSPLAAIVRGTSATKQDWQRPRVLSVEEIIQVVSIETGIKESSIKSAIRLKEIVEARHLAMYFVRQRTSLSVVRIGRFFGKDHTSILSALKKVRNHYDTEQPYRIKFHSIEWLLDKAARL